MIRWLARDTPFPPIEQALAEPNGLLAAGGELTPERVLDAYSHGIFPWPIGQPGDPLLWFSPDPRMVLFVDEVRVSRSLRKRVASARYEIRVDTSFEAVIGHCARVPRGGHAGTWITPGIVAAYTELHLRGYAHAVEAWRDGRLVGGLYGIALGRVFFGESMFALESDASKVALLHLIALLRRQSVPLVDCQQETRHLASLGARPIPRARFAAHLAELIHSLAPPRGWVPGPVAVGPT